MAGCSEAVAATSGWDSPSLELIKVLSASNQPDELAMSERYDTTGIHLGIPAVEFRIACALREAGQSVKKVGQETIPLFLGELVGLLLDIGELHHWAILSSSAVVASPSGRIYRVLQGRVCERVRIADVPVELTDLADKAAFPEDHLQPVLPLPRASALQRNVDPVVTIAASRDDGIGPKIDKVPDPLDVRDFRRIAPPGIPNVRIVGVNVPAGIGQNLWERPTCSQSAWKRASPGEPLPPSRRPARCS